VVAAGLTLRLLCRHLSFFDPFSNDILSSVLVGDCPKKIACPQEGRLHWVALQSALEPPRRPGRFLAPLVPFRLPLPPARQPVWPAAAPRRRSLAGQRPESSGQRVVWLDHDQRQASVGGLPDDPGIEWQLDGDGCLRFSSTFSGRMPSRANT